MTEPEPKMPEAERLPVKGRGKASTNHVCVRVFPA